MDAIERIRREGYDEGFKESFKEGFTESFKEAEAKFQERLLKIAKELIKDGLSLDFVASTLKLDAQKLANLPTNIV